MRLFQAPPFYYHETTAATFLTGPLEEGGRELPSHPDFGESVNPISTGVGRLLLPL